MLMEIQSGNVSLIVNLPIIGTLTLEMGITEAYKFLRLLGITTEISAQDSMSLSIRTMPGDSSKYVWHVEFKQDRDGALGPPVVTTPESIEEAAAIMDQTLDDD